MERLFKKRLQPTLTHPLYASTYQYGLRKGKSAEDAHYLVRQQLLAVNGKYAIAILFDATAAFDLLWWPSVFRELSLRGCPRDLSLLLASYLEHRRVTLQGNCISQSRNITKGCPQGSILGPDLWNFVMDTLLRRSKRHLYSVR